MRVLAAAGVVAMGLMCTGAANATVFTRTAVGTVKSGTDPFGIFGTVDADLTGLSFSIVSTWDTALGDLIYYPVPPYGISEILHTKSLLLPSPGSSKLTISGNSFTNSGSNDAYIVATPWGTSNEELFEARWVDGVRYTSGLADSFEVIPSYQPSHLLEYFSVDCSIAYTCWGDFSYGGAGKITYLVFDFDNITMRGPLAVPEPHTWALMLIGFGLVGATLRKRATVAV